MKTLNRREFLRISALTAAASLAAACDAGVVSAPSGVAAPATVAPGGATAQPIAGSAVSVSDTPVPGALPSRYQEAPALAERVAAGELPPVEERLPLEPLVLPPVDAVGQYGGTLRSMKQGEAMNHVHLMAWCENFAKWRNDIPGSGHRPNLLTAWEWNEAGTAITLHFRKGIRWSDGHPLTVDDWLFWWFDVALDPNIPVGRQSGTFVGEHDMEVERVDDYTLILSWPVVNPLFLPMISRGVGDRASSWQVAPAHYLKQFHYKYNDKYASNETTDFIDHWSFRDRYTDMPHFGPWLAKEQVPGERIILERNPYYWKVDPEGRQLPYIDEVVFRQVATPELLVLSSIEGDIDFIMRGYQTKDLPVLKENEPNGDYQIRMWQQGDGTASGIIFHYCYPDQSIADLLWNQKFRQAISVAINRERINDIACLGLARIRNHVPLSTGGEFQSERGQRILKEWETRWTEYDPEQAKAWLDEIGVVDVDGDGFREKPDGSPLELIIDVDVNNAVAVDTQQLVLEDLAAVGLKYTLNVIDGTLVVQRGEMCESMIREYGGSYSGLIIAPGHWAPVENAGYLICGNPYGRWYQSGGLDGIAPPPGSFIEKLQEAYTRAMGIADEEERNNAILDGYELHLEYGPIQIGTAGERRNPVLVKNGLMNVTQDGIIGSNVFGYPGTSDPEAWWWA